MFCAISVEVWSRFIWMRMNTERSAPASTASSRNGATSANSTAATPRRQFGAPLAGRERFIDHRQSHAVDHLRLAGEDRSEWRQIRLGIGIYVLHDLAASAGPRGAASAGRQRWEIRIRLLGDL